MTRLASNLFVVMGTTGTGKSSVAKALARELNLPFQEGDELHSAANVDKMSRGIPLTDQDRWPWLARCHDWLVEHAKGGGILTCSALKRAYRDVLRKDIELIFIYLSAPEAVLDARLAKRKHHYMPASLIPSQLRTLEPPAKDEPSIEIDAVPPKDEVCHAAIDAVRALHESNAQISP